MREWMHPTRDGGRLFVRVTEPADGAVRGNVLLTHGMGEHLGRYDHVARVLNDAGLRVIRWDLRGHGRSSGPRGDIRAYDVLVEDMLEIWDMAGPGPVFLYGHSMGAQITLNFAARHRPQAAGLIITSPWLRLAFVPPRWKLVLAAVAARTWPSFTQETEVFPKRLSRDLEFLAGMPNGELIHHRMSARMYRELVNGAARAARDSVRLRYPILMIHGSDDAVTSAAATEELFRLMKSRDKQLSIIPEALHETHNDVCREDVLRQIVNWLEARLTHLDGVDGAAKEVA